MLTVELPFKVIKRQDADGTQNRHRYAPRDTELCIDSDVDNQCKDLLESMLATDPASRLNIDQVLAHPFFSN